MAQSTFSRLFPVRWLAAWSGQRFIVPLYHTVADDPPPHIRHLYPIRSRQQFLADLDFLLKHHRPIEAPALEKLLHEGIRPKSNTFLLTFDDGLREFYDVIAPLLLQKGIPAICFLNSDFVDNKDLFFRHKASLLLDFFEHHQDALQHPMVKMYTHLPGPRPTEIRTVLLHVRYQTQAILNNLAAAADLDFSQYLAEHRPYLDSVQVQSLKNQGFYFGAPGYDRPDYRVSNPEEQIRQTQQSIDSLCGRFDLPYRAVAFNEAHVSQDFFQKLYEKPLAVDVSFGAAGLTREVFPRHIPRIPFETDHLSAGEILHEAYFNYLLKGRRSKTSSNP